MDCAREMGNAEESLSSGSISISSRIEELNVNELPIVEEVLDLSARNAIKVFFGMKQIPIVKVLKISNNRLKYLHNISVLPNCVEVIADHNNFERIVYFVPLRNMLKKLNLAHNVISNCKSISSLFALNWLDMSFNMIQNIPSLDRLTNLMYLNISSNRIAVLPNLKRLENLRELKLNCNNISSLKKIAELVPNSLKSLDVGANAIENLKEAQYLACLSLVELVWRGNPCVISEKSSFTYRPYLYCCCLENLKVVDGFELLEVEILAGEHLHNEGKMRYMLENAEICSYLEKKSPLDFDSRNQCFSSIDNRFQKVLEKRREHQHHLPSNIDSHSEISIASPFEEWLSKANIRHEDTDAESLDRKENRAPIFNELIENAPERILSPASSSESNISSRTVTLSNTESGTADIQARSRLSVSVTDCKMQKNVFIVKPHLDDRQLVDREAVPSRTWPKRHDHGMIGTAKSRSVKKAGYVSLSCFLTSRSNSENEAAIFIQSWWRGTRVRRKICFQIMQRRLKLCEKALREKSCVVNSLVEQCEQLTKITEEQAAWINDISHFILKTVDAYHAKYMALLRNILPVPVDLQFSRISSTEIVIQWKNSIVHDRIKGYVLAVNGVDCGTITAKQKKAVVTELDPIIESRITVRCICDNDILGARSESLRILPNHSHSHEAEN